MLWQEKVFVFSKLLNFTREHSFNAAAENRPLSTGRLIIVMVDKNSATPMYRQIYDTLAKEIEKNSYKSGKLPSQGKLVEKFNVSLITIRKALQLLEDRGLLVKKQGKGTFVSGAKVQDTLTTLKSASSALDKIGIEPKVEIIDLAVIDVPEEVKENVFGNLGSDRCVMAKRVHSENDVPICYALIYLPLKYAENITTEDLVSNTIYQFYENKLGVVLGNGSQIIRAAAANKETAQMLKIRIGAPILMLQRCSYSRDEELIEFIKLYYPHNKYEIKVSLKLKNE